MLQRFLDFIEAHALHKPGQTALLAVSGGLDSVVMAHLFHQAQFSFAIAHCNFQLRGKESDEDAEFVEALSKTLGVECYQKRFDVEAFAKLRGFGLQEAARVLRYEWMGFLSREKGFEHIATAHHLDDSIETMLFNLIRGCGLRGLHGIRPRHGRIIRPLLFAFRSELEEWARMQNLSWRDDSSNTSTHFDRNKIRLEVIPAMEKVHPRLRQNLVETMERLRQTEIIFDAFLAQFRDQAFYWSSGRLCLKKSAFTYGPANQTLMHELLAPFGFNPSQTRQILQAFEHQPGARFSSDTHELLVDREHLEIVPLSPPSDTEFEIQQVPAEVEVPEGTFRFEWLDAPPEQLEFDHRTLFMDADKVQFPLRLRRWRAGDVFQPLGMKGHHQKLQDFFTNNKLTRFDKEQVWILEDRQKICWVAGYRPDERVKVCPATRRILKVVFMPNTFAPDNSSLNLRSNPRQ